MKGKNVLLGIIVIILVLITMNINSCNKVKNAKTNLEKIKLENTTLQEALKHPRIIEKPVEIIRWKTKYIPRKGKEIVEGSTLGDVEIVEKIVEVEKRGERISEPYLPSLPSSFSVSEVKRENWTPIVGYNITNEFWTLGLGRRIYKSIKVYGEYNFDDSIEAKISVGF